MNDSLEPDPGMHFRQRSNTWPVHPRNEEDDFSEKKIKKVLISSIEDPTGIHSQGDLQQSQAPKKSNSRRNAWGNMSYAELITKAIQESPEGRLTLAQIYEWMILNVDYFRDKGDSNSSAGWKNSIRHNLSLHNRFQRIQNEGTGKSSWWVLNPDAKTSKHARRRAVSMETAKYDKRRRNVKKKIESQKNLSTTLNTTPSPASSTSENLDHYPDSPHPNPILQQVSPQADYRQRSSSNASSCSRLSPIHSETDLQDNQVIVPIPQWHQPQGSSTMSGGYVNGTGSLHRLQQGEAHPTLPNLAELNITNQQDALYSKHGLTSNGVHSPIEQKMHPLVNGNGAVHSAIDSKFSSLLNHGSNNLHSPIDNSHLSQQPTLIPNNHAIDHTSNGLTAPFDPSNHFYQYSYDPGNEYDYMSPIQTPDVKSNITQLTNQFNTSTSGLEQHYRDAEYDLEYGVQSQPPPPYGQAFSQSMSSPLHTNQVVNFTVPNSYIQDHYLETNHHLRPSSLYNSLSSGSTSPLPQDVQSLKIEGDLECDLNKLIESELDVEGNLDFTIEPWHPKFQQPIGKMEVGGYKQTI